MVFEVWTIARMGAEIIELSTFWLLVCNVVSFHWGGVLPSPVDFLSGEAVLRIPCEWMDRKTAGMTAHF